MTFLTFKIVGRDGLIAKNEAMQSQLHKKDNSMEVKEVMAVKGPYKKEQARWRLLHIVLEGEEKTQAKGIVRIGVQSKVLG